MTDNDHCPRNYCDEGQHLVDCKLYRFQVDLGGYFTSHAVCLNCLREAVDELEEKKFPGLMTLMA